MDFYFSKKQVKETKQQNNLANIRCPACEKMTGYIYTTKVNHCVGIGCRSCGGRMVGERMCAVYISKQSIVSDISFNKWTAEKMRQWLSLFNLD